jgi:hypothetical protein
MSLLGLELSDAGIMIAGGNPAKLLEVDGGDKASPGFALADDTRLLVGKDAQEKARLNPRLFTNHFWDELGTELLTQPGFEGKNNAELAYAHLSRIWDTIKGKGTEMVMAVPGFFTQRQLGLILGIAKELSMPVKGFTPLALAASSQPSPEHLLLHLDMHLHRVEVTLLEQNHHLTQKHVEILSGKGIGYLYSAWVKAIADEFVRTTRFDPLDQAVYEQELYNRLPGVLGELRANTSTLFEMKAGSQTYRVILTYDLFAQKGSEVFGEIHQLIKVMMKKKVKSEMPLALEVTHRISTLPHYRDELYKIPATRIKVLEPGSAALGVLGLSDQFSSGATSQGVALLTSRPWQRVEPADGPPAAPRSHTPGRPTHVLYGNVAYPLSQEPLVIGQGQESEVTIRIPDDCTGVSPRHCTIQLKGDEAVLTNQSDQGTLVDGTEVSGTAVVTLGQTIQVGTSGEQLRLIACVGSHET